MNIVKIEEQTNLYRDISTGAVINTSLDDLESAIESKKLRVSHIDRINNLEDKVDRIIQLLESNK